MKKLILIGISCILLACADSEDSCSLSVSACADGGAGAGSEDPDYSPVEFVYIEGGTFTMGNQELDDWQTSIPADIHRYNAHPVQVSSFYMSKYEITQAQYKDIIGTNPSYFDKGGKYPVENVNWYEAVIYCNRLSIADGLEPVYFDDSGNTEIFTSNWINMDMSKNGYRLPTEAEWEYAARANSTSEKVIPADGNLDGRAPVAVGSYAPNAWGLYDMHGNVEEWVYDYYGSYPTNLQINPTGPNSGTDSVIRGESYLGNYHSNNAAIDEGLYHAFRSAMESVKRSRNVGIRLVHR
jgi:formylglycine-generating enzyme required for sulfatase activity